MLSTFESVKKTLTSNYKIHYLNIPNDYSFNNTSITLITMAQVLLYFFYCWFKII